MSLPVAREAEIAARRVKAVRMRLDGHPWYKIASELGYADAPSAATDVRRALEQSRKELALATEDMREVELQRLDDLERAARTVLDAMHIVVQHGRVVRTDTGEEVVDHDPALRAVDRLLKIAERRARLLGLDSPTKHEVSGQVLYAVEGIDPGKLM